jgi:hypothetical protein
VRSTGDAAERARPSFRALRGAKDDSVLPEERVVRFERRVPVGVAHFSDQPNLYHVALGATRRFSTGVLRGCGDGPGLPPVTRNGLSPEVFRGVADEGMAVTGLR